MTPTRLVWRGMPVPWVTTWSREQSLPSRFVRHVNRDAEERLGYADEHPSDRRNGVLWVRMSVLRGRGRPDFAGLHPLRQRHAMTHLLCQVCGTTTIGTREDERHLFVVVAREGPPLREGETVVVPPVHETCALQAVEQCPHLRRGWTAALVGWAPAWGVAGALIHPDTLDLISDPADLVEVPYEDEQRLRWIYASREVISLHEVEPITLDRLEHDARSARAPA
ncbi:hypothetical protein DF268_36095 [Streptomyces sp. V2]|uniref:hypothetical protein n=1 Tax=Streptomyces sp. V2 TaxID=1424099 RepID=UPI000D66C679|nr:hypothetical protein [Streptomyces sp. V2]PWG08794.1 hypothetical protein DF268_36095 [Streptomyces sp. V2]